MIATSLGGLALIIAGAVVALAGVVGLVAYAVEGVEE